MGLHHIEIYVSDLSKTREFYDLLLPKLGYVLFQEWPEGFSYRANHDYVVFVQTQPRFLPSAYHRCQVGLNHLAFQVPSRDDVDSLAAILAEAGVTMFYADRYPSAGGGDSYALYCEDPDRIKVEVVADALG